MSSPVSSCGLLILVEQGLECAVPGGVVGGLVLPAVPDDEQPGAGEDADGVGVVVAAGAGAVVEVGGPGAGAAGVAGEVGDGVAELFVTRPAEADGAELARLPGGGCGAGEAGEGFGGGKRARQSPISARSRAARTVPERGSEVKMCASACRVSCSAICSDRALICSARVVRTACRAAVTWACAAPSSPVAPRGAAARRACRTAGAVPPQ